MATWPRLPRMTPWSTRSLPRSTRREVCRRRRTRRAACSCSARGGLGGMRAVCAPRPRSGFASRLYTYCTSWHEPSGELLRKVLRGTCQIPTSVKCGNGSKKCSNSIYQLVICALTTRARSAPVNDHEEPCGTTEVAGHPAEPIALSTGQLRSSLPSSPDTRPLPMRHGLHAHVFLEPDIDPNTGVRGPLRGLWWYLISHLAPRWFRPTSFQAAARSAPNAAVDQICLRRRGCPRRRPCHRRRRKHRHQHPRPDHACPSRH